MLKPLELQNIRYTKINESSGSLDRFETTERTIIPTFVPKPNIKAIDVTDLPEDERTELQTLLNEYNEYVQERHKAVFSFEDWASHSKNKDVSVKWRTFKLNNTEVL